LSKDALLRLMDEMTDIMEEQSRILMDQNLLAKQLTGLVVESSGGDLRHMEWVLSMNKPELDGLKYELVLHRMDDIEEEDDDEEEEDLV
jgi:hypothetical protein